MAEHRRCVSPGAVITASDRGSWLRSGPSGQLNQDRRRSATGAIRSYRAEVRGVLVLSQTYPAVPESVAAVRATVASFAANAGASTAIVDSVKLAVSEAATNVIVHAYRDSSAAGLLYLEATSNADGLHVGVADTGSGLRPREDNPGLGLGLAIINHLADEVDVQQGRERGVQIVMRFALAAPG
jgi:serine/threonine-protein kinase RsbW